MIHLDTCYLIQALNQGSVADVRVREWLRGGESFGMSSVAWAEFLCGPLAPHHLALAGRVVTMQVAFDAETAGLAANLFNEGGRRRGSLLDCMIAATAIKVQAPFATMNPSDFERFAQHGLEVIA